MVTLEQPIGTEMETGLAAIEARTRRVLSARFPGSRAAIGWTPSGELLCGLFGWNGFRGLEAAEAVDMVDDALDSALSPEERQHVDFIIPMPMDALLDHLEPLD